ncbi:unnamed protein product, partial [Mesorhabditis belari]|uniref:Uncharacterized protein n=1 Tax=Mesorhabditis belari TaxID=2138241 RepID=A0AAF3EWX4_9BILA
MTGRIQQEGDSSEIRGEDDEKFDFKFRFEKVFACYVIPCLHSSFILYIMAAATMRVPTSIYTIAIMAFVVCDLLAWAGTTLGLHLCAPSFFETLLQRGMTKKLYVWKGISMAFEILILLMLVLVEVIKKERVIDCICVCAAVFLFSGVLGTIFIKNFNMTLEKINIEMQEKSALHEAPSVGVSGYQWSASQIDTDLTQPSVPEFIDFDGPASNPVAPFASPNSRTRPIEAHHSRNKMPYKNEKLLSDAKEGNFSPTGNAAPPNHPLGAPAAPLSEIMSESPPKADAPLYVQNETRRVSSDPRPPFDRNDSLPPPNFSSESDYQQQSNHSTDVHYLSNGAFHQVPPPMLAFTPPETRFRAPSDDANSNFISESSYSNHRM